MPSRNFLQYFIITLKGVAMGAADAVPGVSGGTIAFISGIYEELVTTISNINLSLFKTLKNKGLKAFWEQANASFLLALLIGILISFVSFMRLAKYLIENQPILIWSFFFGLIIASIIYVGKQIKKWQLSTFIALIAGTAIAYYVTTLTSLGTNENAYFLFFAGALAICAMILPGISGSFILVILGAYKTLSDALHDFDLKRIAIFAGGAIIGLLSFSHVLKWLFKNYENTTLALLTGFIVGSLNKIWPWKETFSVYSKEARGIITFSEVSEVGTLSVFQQNIQDFETYKTAVEKSVGPFRYSEINSSIDPQLFQAVLFIIIGFLTIFLLEKIALRKKKHS
jgi:putative membrane protein